MTDNIDYKSTDHSTIDYVQDDPPVEKKKKKLSKILGVSEEEMKRKTALKKLGVDESDFLRSQELLSQIPKPSSAKEESLTGYSLNQIKREKALKKLGTSEEIIEEDISKELSKLGGKYLENSNKNTKGFDLRIFPSVNNLTAHFISLVNYSNESNHNHHNHANTDTNVHTKV